MGLNMLFLNGHARKTGDNAVSPVVGVMLMLAVTIIIASVVSAFAGNAISGTQKAPSANTEIHIRNGGTYDTSYFSIQILGASEPIATKNLKLVTSWSAADGSGAVITGGNTTYARQAVANTDDGSVLVTSFGVPTGFGAGVGDWADATSHPAGAQWGNYTWLAGTTCSDSPSSDYGTSDYEYSGTHAGLDPLQAILGGKWNALRQGDLVTVRVIHIPSGKAIVDQQVAVEG